MLHIYALAAACAFAMVKVQAVDMEGVVTSYRAPYWLCERDSRPVNAGPVRPLCFEGGNPYGRVLFAFAPYWEDLRWLCGPE